MWTFAGDQVLGARVHTVSHTLSLMCSHSPLPSGPTYQNSKSHDFQHTLQREEGGEDDVEHSEGIFIGQRGSIELDGGEEVERSVAWLGARLQI